jgi:hypothetical protein
MQHERTNVVRFVRRNPVLVWEDDRRVHESDGEIRPGFVANTADGRYEIVPWCQMKLPSGFQFVDCYAATCLVGGTWDRVQGAAQQHYETA